VRAKAIAAIAAATAIAALLLPVGATAQRANVRKGRHDRRTVATFTLPSSNGYALSVTLTNRRQLKITALPEREKLLEHLFEFASTEYRLDAPQPRGSDRIKASLGRFGSIDLRFKPDSTVERPAALLGCKGDKERIQVGRFLGHFTFRGERGYTRVKAQKAFGGVTNLPSGSRQCPKTRGLKPQERSPKQRARTALLAMSRRAADPGAALLAMSGRAAKPEAHVLGLATKKEAGNRTIAFAGVRLSAIHKGKEVTLDTFGAVARRDRGRIQEQGTAFVLFAIGRYFKVPDLTHMTSEAVLAPPKPFRGRATFQRESADEVSWTGDLRVRLPGFGAVPFTGNGFETVMCEDSGCRSDK
jgi:hypothetical protein